MRSGISLCQLEFCNTMQLLNSRLCAALNPAIVTVEDGGNALIEQLESQSWRSRAVKRKTPNQVVRGLIEGMDLSKFSDASGRRSAFSFASFAHHGLSRLRRSRRKSLLTGASRAPKIEGRQLAVGESVVVAAFRAIHSRTARLHSSRAGLICAAILQVTYLGS